eukprot:CAMPEP_0197892766 /NCGR_PEP_ID=MMETSP1439-20131203/31507_1 /TAXON_ID=66791 /ORGANISM="Gonyaulax spinifera, Strain CCMP409" /LENGTH=253 /DNA_ID=CAMNT_0043512967 /DNA_START=52 /DNA_END=811 /DNA_ORIENTATION=+
MPPTLAYVQSWHCCGWPHHHSPTGPSRQRCWNCKKTSSGAAETKGRQAAAGGEAESQHQHGDLATENADGGALVLLRQKADMCQDSCEDALQQERQLQQAEARPLLHGDSHNDCDLCRPRMETPAPAANNTAGSSDRHAVMPTAVPALPLADRGAVLLRAAAGTALPAMRGHPGLLQPAARRWAGAPLRVSDGVQNAKMLAAPLQAETWLRASVRIRCATAIKPASRAADRCRAAVMAGTRDEPVNHRARCGG